MNYIESKLSLIGFIQEGINYVLTKNSDSTKYEHLTLYDLFAGTRDSMFYSYVLTKHLADGTLDGEARRQGFQNWQSYLKFQERVRQLRNNSKFNH